MHAVDPAGRTWRIRRRWLPWRRRIRDVPDYGIDLPSVDLGDDPISAVIGVVLLVIVTILVLPFLVVFAGLLLELGLLLALLPLAVLARIALRRPWTIEVFGPGRRFLIRGPLQHEERVVGWRASSRKIHEYAAAARTEPPVVVQDR
ncbi:hypothetical protein ACIB24_15220 [Spongisporangium articulatum]|uniref:DUF983 domain-containing protein n=1 Tax=Spongisporangium articulatum TaxID=3362603 RepID=A0ABW8APW0_9ACTN